MAGQVNIDILYVYDKQLESRFEGITVIKFINGKIEEINFKVGKRIEKGNNIEFIIKKHSVITMLFMYKELILRVTNDMIKVESSKISQEV